MWTGLYWTNLEANEGGLNSSIVCGCAKIGSKIVNIVVEL